MRGLRAIVLPLLGIAIVMVGFVYDVLFAGIPYQDPTPELQARHSVHSAVASGLYKTGGIALLAGLIAAPLIRQKTKPHSPTDDHR